MRWRRSKRWPYKASRYRMKTRLILNASSVKIHLKASLTYLVISDITTFTPKRFCRWMRPLWSLQLADTPLMKNAWLRCTRESLGFGILAFYANRSQTFCCLLPRPSWMTNNDLKKCWIFSKTLPLLTLFSFKIVNNWWSLDWMRYLAFISCFSRQ